MTSANGLLMYISIHAPREGSDTVTFILSPHRFISIHAPPRGERQNCVNYAIDYLRFQSTPPARGATRAYSFTADKWEISIHAPREGSDYSS